MTDTIRGSSAKQGTADAVIAVYGKSTDVQRKAAVNKLRDGEAGREVFFSLPTVSMPKHPDRTACFVRWESAASMKSDLSDMPVRDRWSGKSRILKSAIEAATIEHGSSLRPFVDGPEVKAVLLSHVRAEFYRAYPAADDAKQDAKRKAFARVLEATRSSNLVASREINGVDWIWLVQADSCGQLDTS